MRSRGLLVFSLLVVAGCNGFDGFPRFAFLGLPGGEAQRVFGEGNLATPRFAGADAQFLAYSGLGPGGFESVFRLTVPTQQAGEASVPEARPDDFGILQPPADANGDSFLGSVSGNGRLVAFLSEATNLLQEDTRFDRTHAYVRDVAAGTNALVSANAAGAEANADTCDVAISASGRFVAFSTAATNLLPEASNGLVHVYVLDLFTGLIQLVSHDADGDAGNGDSKRIAISPDGRFVAFTSRATNLVEEDENDSRDVFVYDRSLRMLERVSVDSNGDETLFDADEPAISQDGNCVAFTAHTGGPRQVYLRDRAAAETELISHVGAGFPANDDSRAPAISPDCRFVVFESDATDLVGDDTNGFTDIFVNDRVDPALVRVNLGPEGEEANDDSESPSISPDGAVIGFVSRADNLVVPGEGDPPFDGTFDLYFFDNPLLGER